VALQGARVGSSRSQLALRRVPDPLLSRYEGGVDQNNMFHGHGKLTATNGDVYVGLFNHG
jgi:hypothetical protein